MTHFVGIVIADNQDELAKILERWDENREVEPYFKPEEDIESMSKYYELPIDDLEALKEKMQAWSGREGEIKDGVLGGMSKYNPDSKWDWFVVGGRWENIVPGNVCKAGEVSQYFKTHAEEKNHDFYMPSVIVIKDDWHSTKNWVWFGGYSEIEGVDLNKIIEENKDKKCYIVDFHI